MCEFYCVVKNVWIYCMDTHKVYLLCSSISIMPSWRKRPAIVAKRTRNSASGADNDGTVSNATDVSTASVEQLRSFTVNKLHSHLKRCSLPTSGTKVTMANRLHQYFHTSVNTSSENSDNSGNSDNVALPPLDSGRQHWTTETSVLDGNSSLMQQFINQLSNLLCQFMLLVNSQPMAVNVTNQLPSTSNQPPDTIGDEEASIILPVAPVATSNAVTHHTSNPLPTLINQSSLMSMIPTPANSTDQLLPPVPPRIRERIIKGEYIDFTTLLPKAMFSSGSEPDYSTSFTVQLPYSTGDFSVHPTAKPKKITFFSA